MLIPPPYNIQTYWVKYFPGTEIVQDGLRLGILTSEDIASINEGMDCDVYSNSTKNIAPEKIKAYQAYQIIFKLIPVLPRKLRQGLTREMVERIPVGISSLLSLIIDVMVGLMRFSIDHILYAKYYFYHMTRFILSKFKIKMNPGTRILNPERFSLSIPSKTVPSREDFVTHAH